MNPVLTSPSVPNLVTCLLADRMAEAAALRQAADISAAEPDPPHRFRRFLTSDVRRRSPEARPAPLAQGR